MFNQPTYKYSEYKTPLLDSGSGHEAESSTTMHRAAKSSPSRHWNLNIFSKQKISTTPTITPAVQPENAVLEISPIEWEQISLAPEEMPKNTPALSEMDKVILKHWSDINYKFITENDINTLSAALEENIELRDKIFPLISKQRPTAIEFFLITHQIQKLTELATIKKSTVTPSELIAHGTWFWTMPIVDNYIKKILPTKTYKPEDINAGLFIGHSILKDKFNLTINIPTSEDFSIKIVNNKNNLPYGFLNKLNNFINNIKKDNEYGHSSSFRDFLASWDCMQSYLLKASPKLANFHASATEDKKATAFLIGIDALFGKPSKTFIEKEMCKLQDFDITNIKQIKKIATHLQKHMNSSDFNIEWAHPTYRWTPLHLSVAADNVELLTSLLQKGISTNAKNIYDFKASHTAMHFNAKATIPILRFYNVDFKSPNKFGWTPIGCAIENEHIDALIALKPKPEEIECFCCPNEWTPLLYAAWKGNAELVKFFAVDCAANVLIESKLHETPFMLINANKTKSDNPYKKESMNSALSVLKSLETHQRIMALDNEASSSLPSPLKTKNVSHSPMNLLD